MPRTLGSLAVAAGLAAAGGTWLALRPAPALHAQPTQPHVVLFEKFSRRT